MVGKDGSPHDCPLAVKSHTAEGFTVYITESGKWAISDPGEWNEEGFLPYSMADADGKVYYTKKAAKTALESRKGGDLNV